MTQPRTFRMAPETEAGLRICEALERVIDRRRPTSRVAMIAATYFSHYVLARYGTLPRPRARARHRR